MRAYDIAQVEKQTRPNSAITDSTTPGFLRLVAERGRLVGAHTTGHNAGELMHVLAFAVQQKSITGSIVEPVHAYPGDSLLNQRAASQYCRDRLFSRLTGKLVRMLNRRLP